MSIENGIMKIESVEVKNGTVIFNPPFKFTVWADCSLCSHAVFDSGLELEAISPHKGSLEGLVRKHIAECWDEFVEADVMDLVEYHDSAFRIRARLLERGTLIKDAERS